MVINGTFESAERRSAGHPACIAAAASCGMTGGRVCYARVGTAGTPDGDGWVIDVHAPSLGLEASYSTSGPGGPSLSDRKGFGRCGRGLAGPPWPIGAPAAVGNTSDNYARDR